MILELRVLNHPGVMSHITGLFARRAYNLDSILCTPVGDGTESRVLLQFADTPRLAQIERQLEKMEDVRSVQPRPDLTGRIFQIEPATGSVRT